MNRLEKNIEILERLKSYLLKNPDIRFGQALSNLNLATHRLLDDKENRPYNNEDIFYEEPEQTLVKMRNLNKESDDRAMRQNVHIKHLTWEELINKYGDVLTPEEIEKLKYRYELYKHTGID